MTKFNQKEIRDISYNYITNTMQIFNKKNLLLFNSVVTEQFFNKSVCKWIGGEK
jgi:hypothetical protein